MSSPDVPPSFHPHHLRQVRNFPTHRQFPTAPPWWWTKMSTGLSFRKKKLVKSWTNCFFPSPLPVAWKIQVCQKGRCLYLSLSLLISNFYGFVRKRKIFIESFRLILQIYYVQPLNNKKNLKKKLGRENVSLRSKAKVKKKESKRRHAPVKNTELVHERSAATSATRWMPGFPGGKGGFYLSVDKSL